MKKEEYENLSSQEVEQVRKMALVRTARSFLDIKQICPNCYDYFIVGGYVCHGCGFDQSWMREEY